MSIFSDFCGVHGPEEPGSIFLVKLFIGTDVVLGPC